MPNTVKLKRGTATQWAANNPVLASGEVGVELSVSGSPQALKIGNGTSTWNALPYFIKAGGVPQPIAYGDAGAAGTSVEYARADHKHQTPSTPPTHVHSNATTSVAGFMAAADKVALAGKVNYNDVLMPTNSFGGKKLYINSIDNAMHAADKKWHVVITRHAKVYQGVNYPILNPDYVGQYTITGSGDVYTITNTPKPPVIVVYENTTLKTIGTHYTYDSVTGVITFTYTPTGTITVHGGHEIPKYLDSPVEYTFPNSAALFDGSYESRLQADLGKYIKIRITPDSTGYRTFYQDIGYPYGKIYLSYYNTGLPGTVQYRGYNYTYLAHGISWKDAPASTFFTSGTSNLIQVIDLPAQYGCSIIEIIIPSREDGTALLSEIDWQLSRPDLARSGATVTKFGKNTLYDNLSFKQAGVDNVVISPSGLIEALTFRGVLQSSDVGNLVGEGVGVFNSANVLNKRTNEQFISDLDLATESYADGQDALKVSKAGDTMTGSLSIESTQSGATTEVLYLKNNQDSNDTAAALYFGFSTAANYYHAAMVASRTNLGGSHASKLEFMLRRAVEGVGKTFLASLFSLYYDNITPYASLAASLGVQITGNPTEAIDVNGNLRLRNMATTAGTVFLEADANGVFRQRTKSEFIGDLGVAPLAHYHNESYISLTGEQTLTNNSDKRGSWMPFAYLRIENNAVYKNSAEYCGVLHMQSYSDSREPQEMFNIYVYMQKRGWSTNLDFAGQVPELVICLDGNHNLASNEVVAIMTDTGSVSQGFTFFIHLSAPNKSYRTKITSGRGISYGSLAGDANDSYVTLKALKEEPAQASLPRPAIGDAVRASLLTQVVPNSEVLTIHKKVNLQNQMTLAGTSILQRSSAGILTVRTFAQTISDMALLTTSHDDLLNVHGRIKRQYFSDLVQESDDLGRLAWLIDEKRMAYSLDYGGKDGVWQYLGITKVFPTVNDLMSEQPISEGIIACAITERIAFVSFWNGSVYEWRPLVNEDELLRRSCFPWEGLPSSPMDGHFQISYDKDVISFYFSSGGWQHLPVDSGQRIASPDDDYIIDPVLDKLILVDCTDDDVIITMPVIAQSMGREFIIRYHKGANVVTIIGQSANTVDGQTSITLTTEKDFVRLINDGNADWCLVGGAYS